MADALTADDLRALADGWEEGVAEHDDLPEAARAAADLMDQGWRLTPPPPPGTVACGHTEHIRVRRMVGRQVHPEWRGRAAVGEPWELCQEPPQPGAVTELDLIVFLEWLDSTRQVTEWGDPNATHEDTAREYLAQAPPSGNVTVNADDLTTWLEESEPGLMHHQRNGRPCRSCVAYKSLVAALVETYRDH